MGQDQSQYDGKPAGGPEIRSHERPLQRSSSIQQKAKLEDIIVVKNTPDSKEVDLDETLSKLKKLKIIYPFIRNVSGAPVESEDILPGMNADPITEMLLRYQYHLTECTEAVAFDQNAIGKRMKEIELYSSSVLKDAQERQKQMDSLIANMKKFTEIDLLIDRVNKNLNKTVSLMHNLNQLLPKNEQLSFEELENKGKNS